MLWYEGWLSYAQREAEAMMNPPPPPPALEDVQRLWDTLDATMRSAGYRYSAHRRYAEAERELWQLATRLQVQTACKVGMDLGHSAVGMIMATATTKLILFDTGRLSEDDGHQLPLHVRVVASRLACLVVLLHAELSVVRF